MRARAPCRPPDGLGTWALASSLALAMALGAGLSGCDETLLDGLPEPEANDLVASLRAAGLDARKTTTRGRTSGVSVPPSQFASAWSLARSSGHPRRIESEPSAWVSGPTASRISARRAAVARVERLLGELPETRSARLVADGDGAALVIQLAPGAAPRPELWRSLVRAGLGLTTEAPVVVETLAETHAETLPASPAGPTPARRGGHLAMAAVLGGAGVLMLVGWYFARRRGRRAARTRSAPEGWAT